MQIQDKLDLGQFENATDLWSQLEGNISTSSNYVNFYNFLLDDNIDPLSPTASEVSQGLTMKRYASYLSSLKASPGGEDQLDTLMNGAIKDKFKIIPKNVKWGGQSLNVVDAFKGDFMRPRINEVDKLLNNGIQVTIYNGQVDLICATKGTEAWVQKLKWNGLKMFNRMDRIPLYCGDTKTRGFLKAYKNLRFYWILEAGHFVPVEEPCLALEMVGNITNSPAT
ncbi:unnamed protein product [Cuscuta europaea]|nr:unnamed protein product [Cuscuta europaea]